MKIVSMTTYPVSIAYTHVERSSRVNRGGVTDVIVRLESEDGLVGWGESCSGADVHSIVAALDAMRPFVVGRSVWDVDEVARDIYETGLWDYRAHTANFAFSGIDMAMWDLCGKACDQPLHRLWGGAVRDSVEYFYYLSLGEPEEVAQQCRDGVARGYRYFYMKVGIDGAMEETLLQVVRREIGPDAKIRIDANEAWSVPEAVRNITRWHDAVGLDFVEAPVPIYPLDLMRELRSRVPVALCANEGLGTAQDALNVILSGVADVLCFSSVWVGTLKRFCTLAQVAAFRGQTVCKHTHGELGIAAAAQHQALLTLGNVCPGAQQTASLMEDDILRTPVPISSGPNWGVTGGPGLGVDVDEEKLTHYAEQFRSIGQFLPYGTRPS